MKKHHFEGAGPPLAGAPGRHLQPESSDSSAFLAFTFSMCVENVPARIKTSVFFTTSTWWATSWNRVTTQSPFTEKTRRRVAATEHEIDPRSEVGSREGVTALVGAKVGFPRGDLDLDGHAAHQKLLASRRPP